MSSSPKIASKPTEIASKSLETVVKPGDGLLMKAAEGMISPTSPTTTTMNAAAELRHVTSSAGLSLSTSPNRPGRRTSQHLRTSDARLGSPSSIPSSPTSIHSSSSAIFERDIEPILPPSPPSHNSRPLDPHRIPRAKNTEQLEQAVPSVLDSAAAILTSTLAVYPAGSSSPPSALSPPNAASPEHPSHAGHGPTTATGSLNHVEVVAPIASSSIFEGRTGFGAGSGFASPLSLRSRSPSPGPGRPESLLLLNASTSPQSLTVPPDGQSEHATSSTSTPAHPSTVSAAPIARSVSASSYIPTSSPLASPTSHGSHPPSPSHTATKRLSFMSYSDLLTSTPASTHTLSSLTTSASPDNPPPHIPSVSGLNLLSATASIASAANSIRGLSLSPTSGGHASVNLVPTGGLTHPGKRDSIALLDNVGGEWEREGLGRSLEERLEGELKLESEVGSVRGASPVVVGGNLPIIKA